MKDTASGISKLVRKSNKLKTLWQKQDDDEKYEAQETHKKTKMIY